MSRFINYSTLEIMIIVISIYSTISAKNSSIEGYIKDKQTGEPMIGANVVLEGTSMGAATDIDGKYVISNLLPGNYTIHVTYIGYKEQSTKITVIEGKSIRLDFKLELVGIEGETVVVTAQASGQKQAINQQLTSNQIVNIVSAAKIQELPDANAAESVGRLPGVSILRSGGEGNQVVIRGLAPKYNKVLIDGVQMSSSDPDNRSTDLSMISSNMLEGIQVSKTVTPDMDPDVIGGTVNFELREAKEKETGAPLFGILLQGSYNNLSNAYNEYNNYKYVFSVEDRLLDKRLGIFAQVNIERKNLTSNEMGATYTNSGNSTTQYLTTGLNLYNIPRDRQRYNGALVLDYKLPEGKIKLMNFISSGSTASQTREEIFDITTNTRRYNLAGSNDELNIITNAFDFEHKLSIFDLNTRLSHTYSETKNPKGWEASFLQTSAGINGFINLADVDPRDIPKAANNDLSSTYLTTFENNYSFARERSLTASIDLKANFTLSDLISTEIKFGGKYRYQFRSYDYDIYDSQSLISGTASFVDNIIANHFGIPQSTSIPIRYFTDPNYNYGEIFGGDYIMISPLNYGMLGELAELLKTNAQYIADNNGSASYSHNNFLSTTYDYSGHENQSAFYIMPVFNIGPKINIITGVRYQYLKTTYSGIRGIESLESWYEYNHYDTTVTQNHGYWLPALAIRYKPLSWFDVRFSYTNTLAYPDYNTIIPRIDVASFYISWLNYKLVPSRSTNYDIYFSFYNNTLGLFTIGGFLKQIDNLIYPWTFHVSGDQVIQYLPMSLIETYNSKSTYHISTFVNDSYRIDNYGMELDWQTHFWYLPDPLSGLVFSINYTHIFSEAEYPYTQTVVSGRTIEYVDTSFTDRLLYQPEDIVNLSIGFDYKGFSIRTSMIYQTDVFTGPNFWPQLRAHTSGYRRWDLAVKQELPWYGIQLFGNINNINSAKDVSVQGGGVPTSMQDYGLTADLGIRWKF